MRGGDQRTSILGARHASIALAAVLVSTPLAQAQTSVADFYRGKTIEFDIGYSPGGAYDLYARLVARFMGEHIPGKPSIVPRNMAGGGGRVVTGYVYKVAPRDGTVLATADQSLVLQQAIGDPSIQFDLNKLLWIGNPNADNNTVATWYTTGVKTIADAQSKEVVIGATGPNTSSQVPLAMNVILHTKFKIVTGYPGGNDINLAMEKGEVGGRGLNAWSAWKATKPDWLRDKKINILAQIGLTKAPDLPDTPLLTDFATNDEDRAVLKIFSAPTALGRPIFTAPNISPDRLQALRTAFDETMRDPTFLEQAKLGGFDINPVSGVEMQKIVGEIISSPKVVTDRLAAIMNAN